MHHPYKIVLLILELTLLYVIFAHKNQFDNALKTTARAFLAIIVGWYTILMTSLAVTKIDLRLAETPERVEHIMAGDGAKHVFALFFGWAYVAIEVGLIWIVCRVLKRFRSRSAFRMSVAKKKPD